MRLQVVLKRCSHRNVAPVELSNGFYKKVTIGQWWREMDGGCGAFIPCLHGSLITASTTTELRRKIEDRVPEVAAFVSCGLEPVRKVEP